MPSPGREASETEFSEDNDSRRVRVTFSPGSLLAPSSPQRNRVEVAALGGGGFGVVEDRPEYRAGRRRGPNRARVL